MTKLKWISLIPYVFMGMITASADIHILDWELVGIFLCMLSCEHIARAGRHE